ncbi:MAG TPA: hypothetical protein VL588_06890, partial [Bdellovibrionota bacterium]|nr:hypothetical protein [Bdellovibrionota bacterium]
DVVIPPLNTPAVNWHFYFGTRGQLYVGAAAVIPAINQQFPAVNVGYTFYDSQGRVVLGLRFFGPSVNPQTGVFLSPGGIWIGSNLSPFLPPELQIPPPGGVTPDQGTGEGTAHVLSMSQALRGADPWELAATANRGGPLEIGGQSVVADVQVLGRDGSRYQTRNKIQGLIDRYTAASRRTH